MIYIKLKFCVTAAFLSALFLSACVPPAAQRTHQNSVERRQAVAHNSSTRKSIVALAKKQIGIRYRRGAASPSRGFDCSGLTAYVYGKNRIAIPRSSSEQYFGGEKISPKKVRPGDLLFFDIYGYGISHVGIFIGKNKFVHAPGTGKKVRIDSIKNPYWKKRFAGGATYIY